MQGGVDPHVGAVLALATQPRLLRAARREDRQPALDRAALVVGVDLVEHRLPEHLLRGVPEHVDESLVAVEHVRALVLHQAAEARDRRRQLLGLAAPSASSSLGSTTASSTPWTSRRSMKCSVAQLDGRRSRRTFAAAAPSLCTAIQSLRHRRAVGGDDVIEHGAAVDRSLAPQPDRLRYGHDQAVAGEPADERVRVLAQQRFRGGGERLCVIALEWDCGWRCF